MITHYSYLHTRVYTVGLFFCQHIETCSITRATSSILKYNNKKKKGSKSHGSQSAIVGPWVKPLTAQATCLDCILPDSYKYIPLR